MEHEKTQPADWVIRVPRMHLEHVVWVHSRQRDEQRTATTRTSVKARNEEEEKVRVLFSEMLVVSSVLVSYCSWLAPPQMELIVLAAVYVVAF